MDFKTNYDVVESWYIYNVALRHWKYLVYVENWSDEACNIVLNTDNNMVMIHYVSYQPVIFSLPFICVYEKQGFLVLNIRYI